VRPRQVRQLQQKVVDQAAPPVVSGHAGAAEAQLGARQRRDGHGLLPQALVHALFQPGLTAPQAVAGDVGVEQILQAHCDPPASGSDCGASFAERHKFVAGGQASQIEQEGLQRVGIGLEPERDLVGVLIARDPHPGVSTRKALGRRAAWLLPVAKTLAEATVGFLFAK